MGLKFITPDLSDERIKYAAKHLESKGFNHIEKERFSDFVLLGVNPNEELLSFDKTVFAGNVKSEGVYDYTKSEVFAIKNAFLTAEGTIALATQSSKRSLINSNVLITGYGRIGKALHRLLHAYTGNITVCARSNEQRALAHSSNADTISFDSLTDNGKYDFIFNTVPHPVFTGRELYSVSKDAVIIDLASFPGGVDKHIARVRELNLITAKGLPAVYSPESAGCVLGEAVIEIIEKDGLFKNL